MRIDRKTAKVHVPEHMSKGTVDFLGATHNSCHARKGGTLALRLVAFSALLLRTVFLVGGAAHAD